MSELEKSVSESEIKESESVFYDSGKIWGRNFSSNELILKINLNTVLGTPLINWVLFS